MTIWVLVYDSRRCVLLYALAVQGEHIEERKSWNEDMCGFSCRNSSQPLPFAPPLLDQIKTAQHLNTSLPQKKQRMVGETRTPWT
jgi:hypothetical protein